MNRTSPESVVIRLLFIVLWMVSISPWATGQLSRPGNPIPLQYEGSKPIEVYKIAFPAEAKSGRVTGGENPWLKSGGSGFVADVQFDWAGSGTWDTLSDGTKLWRAGFQAEGAGAIRVVFRNFNVNKGVRVFLYDELQQQVLGAFSDLNNRPDGILATAQVFGQLLIVEVNVPAYLDDPGSLLIAQIGCEFPDATVETGLKDGWYGLSGECNEDVNCYPDAYHQQPKYSVVRIVYDGGERCTGTLVNNVAENERNYLLTAAHCIIDEQTANTAVFYFDYESPYCGGPDGNSQSTISGATIRAKADSLDFVLLELLESVPFDYHPYYAGWNMRDDPPASGFTIHHPKGDVKKIAIEEHALSEATFSAEFLPNSHWLVGHWEIGTTEKGSSGAAFFDQDGRIAGTLTGGQASCDNSVNDYFQKFSTARDHLDLWLDPMLSGTEHIDGYDPYGSFWATGDTLSNIQPEEVLEVNRNGLQWGSLSGHNSFYVTQFAEQFVQNDSRALFGLLLNVADNYVASASSHLTLRIWDGGEFPETLLAEKQILPADLARDARQMILLDSIVSVRDTFFVGYEVYYDLPMDTFSVWMAGNRSPSQENTAFVYNGTAWVTLTAFTSGAVSSSFDIRPVVFDADQVPGGPEETGILVKVYPNPATHEFWVEFPEITTDKVRLELFDLRGQLMSRQEFQPYQTLIRLDAEHITEGIYFLRVTTGVANTTVKLIILKQ